MSKKMRYHLTITDNVTGEVAQDVDFNVMIGSVKTPKGEASIALSSEENVIEIGSTVAAAYLAAEYCLRELPELVAESVIHLVNSKMEDKIKQMKEADGRGKKYED